MQHRLPLSHLPAPKTQHLTSRIGRVAPIDKVIERTNEFLPVLKAEGAYLAHSSGPSLTHGITLTLTLALTGITRFVGVGFCWGAITCRALSALDPALYVGLGFIHGRAFTAEQGKAVRVPIINLPSKGEGEQPEFHAALPEEGGIREKSAFQLFGDVPHGFASGRGDWRDELKRKRAQEVIEVFVEWVDRVVIQG